MIDFNNPESFQEFYNESPCGFITIDKFGMILQANNTFLNMVECSHEELIGKKRLMDFMIIADKIYYDTIVLPLILIQKSAKEINLNLINKKKIKIPILINARIINKSNNEFIDITIIEFTQRKSYEKELLSARKKAESLVQSLDNHISVINKEIEKATSIQRHMLPKPILDEKYGLSIEFLYLPLDNVSGDLLDYFLFKENRYRFFIADATGHGLQAGFQTMGIQAQYQKIKDLYDDPSDILKNLNESTIKIFKNTKIIFTCCVIDIDLNSNKLTYASAGHPSQILIQDMQSYSLSATGPLIGFRNDLVYPSNSIELNEEFLLIIYTDGIIETLNSEGSLYDEEKFIDITNKYFNEKASLEFFKFFYNDFDNFRGDSPIRDDITLIKVERLAISSNPQNSLQ